MVWIRREGKRLVFGKSVPWAGACGRVKLRAGVSRLFSNRGTGPVALVLRRRAQERRGESYADDVEKPKSGGAEGPVDVTRAAGFMCCFLVWTTTAKINEQ